MARDPPRKSEQTCRVRRRRSQRVQPRRPIKCGPACTERRRRDDRERRHSLRLHSAQRQRRRGLLGNAESSSGGLLLKIFSSHLSGYYGRHAGHRMAESGFKRTGSNLIDEVAGPIHRDFGPSLMGQSAVWCGLKKKACTGHKCRTTMGFLFLLLDHGTRTGGSRMSCDGLYHSLQYEYQSAHAMNLSVPLLMAPFAAL